MSKQTYIKVFELIKESLVPKTQLVEFQTKILYLESMLEKATTELKMIKSESNERKTTTEILQAEKDSLQLEKRAMEVKFTEVSLKLKQKTHQYDSLLGPQAAREQNKTEISVVFPSGTKEIKNEPGIGIVNVPASSSSRPSEPATKITSKRQIAAKNDSQRTRNKRKKVANSNTYPRYTRKSTQSRPIFTCDECLDDWGNNIKWNFQGDPDNSGVPDPKQTIQTFSSFEAYRHHLCETHSFVQHKITDTYCYPNSDSICKICKCSFESQKILDEHIKFEHARLDMTNLEFFCLYLMYKCTK